MGLQPSPPPPLSRDRLQGLGPAPAAAAAAVAVFKRKHAATNSDRSSSDSDESPEEMDVDDFAPVTKKMKEAGVEAGGVAASAAPSSASAASPSAKSKQQLESAGEESDESHTTFEEEDNSSEDGHSSEEELDKVNQVSLPVKSGDFESILAKTLLNSKIDSSTTSSATATTSAAKSSAADTAAAAAVVVANDNEPLADNNNRVLSSAENEDDDDADSSQSPKVIVEHQPLPSIYELQQNQGAGVGGNLDNDQYDSGLSDDSSDGGVEEEDEDDEDSDEDELPMLNASPLYNSVLGSSSSSEKITTPASPMLNAAKPIYQDRFWSQATGSPMAPAAAAPPTPAPTTSTFQFLDQGNQRIECAENGKSYMQLGTMSHHLPVTPVIQPKPLNAGGYNVARRALPPFRMTPQVARPVCDHSNCLQKKQSHCYRTMRARMLNVSLHKLHMARQNHEGSLRRSVLICNMLRKIEDETEKETVAENQAYLSHQQQHLQQQQQQQHQHQHHQQQQQQSQAHEQAALLHDQQTSPPHSMEVDQYWPAAAGAGAPEMQASYASPATPGPVTSSAPPVGSLPSYADTYESTLKDFNTAFRVTPYSSPVHESSSSSSSLSEHEEDREINWGSVLSLSTSQSELDPLNNNWCASSSSSSCTTTSSSSSSATSGSSVVCVSPPHPNSSSSPASSSAPPSTASPAAPPSPSTAGGGGFDDIGWKLSAEDVLRAFPNDENLYVGP